ncbi:MAG: haloacid dehalogenase-like hydrolase [Eubacteriales bacterium]|nr:haloacid dehalogenase-like hydrolase [Eubacteriales bacterium]
MNVYDFDGTIYRHDSTVEFYKYCVLLRPYLILLWPYQLVLALLLLLHIIPFDCFKARFFVFLRFVKNVDGLVLRFWEKLGKKDLEAWYLKQKQPTDVIVSATPAFILEPICRELGVQRLIATRMDKHTGRMPGKNCKGAEKVPRFREHYPNNTVERFYSDSLSDAPMAKLANKSYFVKKGKVMDWPEDASAANTLE